MPQVLQGLRLAAFDAETDLLLLQLLDDPPSAWGVYKAGWDAVPPAFPFEWLAVSHPRVRQAVGRAGGCVSTPSFLLCVGMQRLLPLLLQDGCCVARFLPSLSLCFFPPPLTLPPLTPISQGDVLKASQGVCGFGAIREGDNVYGVGPGQRWPSNFSVSLDPDDASPGEVCTEQPCELYYAATAVGPLEPGKRSRQVKVAHHIV